MTAELSAMAHVGVVESFGERGVVGRKKRDLLNQIVKITQSFVGKPNCRRRLSSNY